MPADPERRNAAWIIVDRGARIGGAAVVMVLVSRALGPAQFGTLSFAAALAALYATLGTLGLDQLVVRELVREPAEAPTILGTTLRMRLVAGLAVIVATLVSALVLRPDDPAARMMALLFSLAALLQAFDVVDLSFQARVLSRPVAIVRTCAFAVAAAVRIAMVAAHAAPVAYAWAAVLEAAIVAAGLRLSYGTFVDWRFSFARARALLRDAAPLALSAAATLVYLRIDQVMVAQLVGDAEVGIYSVAVRLAEAWYFVPMALVTSAMPAVVAATEAERDERMFRLFRRVTFVSYAFAAGLTALGPLAVRLLFGPEYARAAPMLALLAWAGVFAVLGGARSIFLVSKNLMGFHLAAALAGAIVNVALNFLLIPRLGGVGAAIASLAAYATASHVTSWAHAPTRPIARLLTRALVMPLWP